MAVTIAELGERALRRLGVAIVAVADRPALSAPVPAATIALGALYWLAVIASDETPSATDASYALAKVNAVHDGLVAQAIASWPASAIPQAVSEEYTMLTAAHCATSFGKSSDPAQIPVIEARIRHVALILDAPNQATDAVLGVHQDLAARDLVRWSTQDIPTFVENAYIDLAAAALAPLFAAKIDPRDAQMAMRSIAQYVALPTSGERVMAEFF